MRQLETMAHFLMPSKDIKSRKIFEQPDARLITIIEASKLVDRFCN